MSNAVTSKPQTTRVFVQNLESSLYFNFRNSWSSNLEQAFDFEDLQSALQFCEERQLDLNRFRIVQKACFANGNA